MWVEVTLCTLYVARCYIPRNKSNCYKMIIFLKYVLSFLHVRILEMCWLWEILMLGLGNLQNVEDEHNVMVSEI